MATFNNMNELVEYLRALEERIDKLEAENQSLRLAQPQSRDIDGETIIKYVSRIIPNSNIFSTSFWTRALAVYGHFMSVNLVVSAVFMILYFCMLAIGLSSVLREIPQ